MNINHPLRQIGNKDDQSSTLILVDCCVSIAICRGQDLRYLTTVRQYVKPGKISLSEYLKQTFCHLSSGGHPFWSRHSPQTSPSGSGYAIFPHNNIISTFVNKNFFRLLWFLVSMYRYGQQISVTCLMLAESFFSCFWNCEVTFFFKTVPSIPYM